MTIRKSATENGFIIFKDQISLLKLIPDEQLGKSIKMLLENFDELPEKNDLVYEMFATNVRRYREQAIKSRESGLKGGNPTLKGRDNDTLKLQEKNKQNKTKQEYTIQNILDNVSIEIKPAIEKWMQYKKERRESYKPTGLSDCIKKLEKLSDGNGELAMRIVEQSTSNGWAGLFPLKNERGENTTTDDEANMSREERFQLFLKRCGVNKEGGAQ